MLKAAIIGCGGISQVHGWALNNIENAVLSLVCDIEHDKAKFLSEKYTEGRAKITTDWREICDSDIDVIHICTPHYLHAPMALELLRHDKAVFMEKPCAVTMDEFMQLKVEGQKHPGKLGFCFQNRYNETTKVIDRLIAEGSIGKLKGGRAFVTWKRDEDYYIGSKWKGKKGTEGGGVLINQAIHTLDLLVKYLGKTIKVRSTVSNHHLENTIDVEDTVEAYIEFEDERRAVFYATNAYTYDAGIFMELHGESGTISLYENEVILRNSENVQIFSQKEDRGFGKGYWGSGHAACIRDFYESLEGGKAFHIGIKEIENTFYTMMKIYEQGGSNAWKR